MYYLLYSYQPLNGEDFSTIMVFEPHRYDSLEEAEKYSVILHVLRHNVFYPISEDDVRANFNVIVDAVPLCNIESFDESRLCV